MMTSRIAYQLFSYLGLIFLFCMMTGQVAMRPFKIKIPHLCLYFALSTLVNTLRYVTPFSSLQVDGVIEVFLDCQQSKIIYLFIYFLTILSVHAGSCSTADSGTAYVIQ